MYFSTPGIVVTQRTKRLTICFDFYSALMNVQLFKTAFFLVSCQNWFGRKQTSLNQWGGMDVNCLNFVHSHPLVLCH